jgi:hypothetical protein
MTLDKLLEQWRQNLQPVLNIKYIYWKMVRFKRLYEIKKDTGLQIGINTSGSSEIIEAALKCKDLK